MLVRSRQFLGGNEKRVWNFDAADQVLIFEHQEIKRLCSKTAESKVLKLPMDYPEDLRNISQVPYSPRSGGTIVACSNAAFAFV